MLLERVYGTGFKQFWCEVFETYGFYLVYRCIWKTHVQKTPWFLVCLFVFLFAKSSQETARQPAVVWVFPGFSNGVSRKTTCLTVFSLAALFALLSSTGGVAFSCGKLKALEGKDEVDVTGRNLELLLVVFF